MVRTAVRYFSPFLKAIEFVTLFIVYLQNCIINNFYAAARFWFLGDHLSHTMVRSMIQASECIAFCARPTNVWHRNELRKAHSVCGGPNHATVMRTTPEVALPQTSDVPKWAGGGPLSDVVNKLIGNKPLFAVMQGAARSVIKKTALENGVDWDAEVARYNEEIPEAVRAAALDRNTDPQLEFPEYYVQKFHAYDEGNLNWLAAFEQESATYSTALRTFRDMEGLTPDIAMKLLRDTHLDAVFNHVPKAFELNTEDAFVVVDAGCGVGLSTVPMMERLESVNPAAKIEMLGLDASPYFLAMAEHRQKTSGKGVNIRYKHALAEDTKLPSEYCNWYSLQYVIHEMPAHIIANVFEEAFRMLKSGGVLSFCDNNPKSKTIQNLPPVLFTLMKSTEPYTDSYYRLDVEKLLGQIGFVDVLTVPSDHRHRTVVAVKP